MSGHCTPDDLLRAGFHPVPAERLMAAAEALRPRDPAKVVDLLEYRRERSAAAALARGALFEAAAKAAREGKDAARVRLALELGDHATRLHLAACDALEEFLQGEGAETARKLRALAEKGPAALQDALWELFVDSLWAGATSEALGRAWDLARAAAVGGGR